MEPNDDSQLSSLLKEWRAPATPLSLEQRVLGQQNWWHFLVRGYIRVPVPVVCCLALLMAGGVWTSLRLAAKAESCLAVSHAAVPSMTCPTNSKC
jgi:hypothetical protein